jgi:hypothetical protein
MTADDKKELIKKLRKQQRDIKKELNQLLSTTDDSKKLAEWKLIHDIKQDVKARLKEKGISWKKLISTPDYFNYAWYVNGSTAGAPKRLKTSMDKPASTETATDEATMIKQAAEQRSKIVRKKAKRNWKKTPSSSTNISSGKAKAVGSIGVG